MKHYCCYCRAQITTIYLAREKRGNRAEVCSIECAIRLESE